MVSNKSYLVVLFQFFQAFLSSIIIILIARSLGASAYGRYVFFLTSSSLLPLLSGLGFEHVLILHASRNRKILPFKFGNALFLRVVLTILILLFLAIYLLFFRINEFWTILFIASGSLLAVFSNPLFLSLYRVLGLHFRPWIICLFSPIFLLAYVIAFSSTVKNIHVISVGFFLSNILPIILFVIDTKKHVKYRISLKLIKKDIKIGLLFSASQFFDFLFSRIDVFLLNYILGAYSLGIYSAAQRLTNIFNLIPSSFHIVELPEFHRLSDDYNKLIEKFRSLRLLLLEISLIVFTILIINSHQLINFIFGSEYIQASNVVLILSISSILFFVNYPYYMLAEATNVIIERFYVRIFVLIITIISIKILIKNFGFYGVAFGVFLGQFALFCLLHYITRNKNGGIYKLLLDLRIIILAVFCGFMSFALGSYISNLFIQITIQSITFIIIYSILAYWLRLSYFTTKIRNYLLNTIVVKY